MIFATGWLSLHLFGVFITFALLVIVSQKEDATYKSELLLTIACCLVTLVAKSIYIVGGSRQTLLTIGKLEYLGKSFANYCALMFILRWQNIKIPKWFINALLFINCAFYILIATVDLHHWYYKDYWLNPSQANMRGYTLEIAPAPMYYIYGFSGYGNYRQCMCDCFLVSFQKGYARSPESAYHPAVFHAFPCDPSLPAPSWHFKMGRPDTARNVFRLRVYVYCRRQIQNDRPGKKRKKPDHSEFK